HETAHQRSSFRKRCGSKSPPSTITPYQLNSLTDEAFLQKRKKKRGRWRRQRSRPTPLVSLSLKPRSLIT
ncbi:hypothetical protein SK128_001390, partial [Halocaridina rubra]